jgi:hypothetical protein
MKKTFFTIIIVILLAVIGSGSVYYWQTQGELPSDNYEAVFLTNGQVYFAKVANKNMAWVDLTDIYYLELTQPLQSQDQEEAAVQPDLALIKLGNELHGPKDKMEVFRSNILFIEELSEDSEVLQAIQEHKAQ